MFQNHHRILSFLLTDIELFTVFQKWYSLVEVNWDFDVSMSI